MSDNRDDFWDIDKLLPKRRNSRAVPFSTKEKTVEYKAFSDAKSPDTSDNKLTLTRGVREAEETVYTFTGGLVRSVKISRFIDKYDFYGNFRKAALVYYDFKTPKCEFAPFYSYMPQYSQFNSQQKNFYFYWRDCVRRKKYIKTDYSYFYLYVYEILNLPDKINREEGLRLLVTLWRAYRAELPNIDANMSLWIQDYCLVYNLPCPMDEIKDFIFDVIGAAEFKEFYLSGADTLGNDGINALIAYLSDYDWRRGKYAGGESREVYAKHLIGAMGLLIKELWESGKIASSISERATVTRNAFRNSLCTHSVKCRLEIEYVPFSKADWLRRAVTAALKYTENKLRGLLGVRSRLAVKDLPDEYGKIIDSYFADVYEQANRARMAAMRPEYEKLYEAESAPISITGADEIERLSWNTTARLIVDEEENEIKTEVAKEKTEQNNYFECDTYGLSNAEIKVIAAILKGDTNGILAFAGGFSSQADAIVEKINEAFADGFGDVIIEGEYPEYALIEDYKEDIETWLTKVMK
ncbi:MAG: TerB N-terminal domain-containing protein [Clostridia bacterium]|nr:TerB N-terminal domain-containing protein [Clostridia bacterium]